MTLGSVGIEKAWGLMHVKSTQDANFVALKKKRKENLHHQEDIDHKGRIAFLLLPFLAKKNLPPPEKDLFIKIGPFCRKDLFE